MKRTNTLVTLALIAAVPFLISSENGVAEDQNKDRTGAPGSNATSCNQTNCHDDGQFSPQISFKLMDATGTTQVLEYIGGETYQVRFTVNSAGASVHGFQATALNEANTNAGVFDMPGNFVQLEAVNGRHIIEHSDPNPSSQFVSEWTAPMEGTGDVTFYAAGVAGNGNGFASGDGFAGKIAVSIPELSNAIGEASLSFNALVHNKQALLKNNLPGILRIYTQTGRLVLNSRVAAGQSALSLDAFSRGVYVLDFQSDNDRVSQQVVIF
jgi:hypothetical protein